MYRVAVIGNCQAAGVASSVKFLLRQSYVKEILTWETSKWYPSDDHLITDLATFDHIFIQHSWGGRISEETVKTLHEKNLSVTEYPVITFPAFHPDLIYITVDGKDDFLTGPIGAYNSAIALFGYLMGLDVDAALTLYTGDVYERLGYFGMWDHSVSALIKEGARFGIDLQMPINEWLREGSFMHSINHAKILPLAHLAKLLLEKAGIPSTREIDLEYIQDVAKKDAIWPIYPEIGRRFGLTGNHVFKKPDYSVQNHLDAYFDLSDFVHSSYASFSYFQKAALKNSRINAWTEDNGLCDWLIKRAT